MYVQVATYIGSQDTCTWLYNITLLITMAGIVMPSKRYKILVIVILANEIIFAFCSTFETFNVLSTVELVLNATV